MENFLETEAKAQRERSLLRRYLISFFGFNVADDCHRVVLVDSAGVARLVYRFEVTEADAPAVSGAARRAMARRMRGQGGDL
ncbi:hypothetical protein ACFIQF_22770 [Comamonas sp. J-3]|uniref:hypothetical protein n=1 Tax=Comamonas trifloxystrobinivorans TaxID=3350256 RepID=UPI0037283EAE